MYDKTGTRGQAGQIQKEKISVGENMKKKGTVLDTAGRADLIGVRVTEQ